MEGWKLVTISWKGQSNHYLWLGNTGFFNNTPKGATSSTVIFSVIETAKANGLSPFRA